MTSREGEGGAKRPKKVAAQRAAHKVTPVHGKTQLATFLPPMKLFAGQTL